MSDLVTTEAVAAAYRVTLTDAMGGAFEDSGEYLTAILEAAAPVIAAQVLRQAASKLVAASFEAWQDDDLRELRGVDWSASQLLELSYDLEGNN